MKVWWIFQKGRVLLPFPVAIKWGVFCFAIDNSIKSKHKEVQKMLKTELEVVTIGEPNIAALQENERRLFFETLYARVLELAKEKKEN